MDFLYNQLIAGKQKAIAGFVAGFVFTLLAKHGLHLDHYVSLDLVSNLVFATLSYVGVYLKANK